MDEESVLRKTVGAMMRHLGLDNVALTEKEEEVLRFYQEAMQPGSPFDIVILDLTVPEGMGGKVAMLKLLELAPNVKAIVSSGYASEDIIVEYDKHRFKGVIAKPYTVNEMRDVIKKVMPTN